MQINIRLFLYLFLKYIYLPYNHWHFILTSSLVRKNYNNKLLSNR